LIDVVFNMGATKIEQKFPRFTAAILAKNWQKGADELKYADGKERLSKWYRDVKPRRADAIVELLREAGNG
jgi:ADP-heptose:LPS heptosyltransferase